MTEIRNQILFLLYLAEKIENRLENEIDETAISCLKNDLEKVKKEIGKKSLQLPLEYSIFDEDYTIIKKEMNNSSILDFNSDLPNENNLHISNEIIENDNKNELLYPKEVNLINKFEDFLKKKTKPKSKLPIRTSK